MTKAELREVQWQDVIAAAATHECFEYIALLNRACSAAVDEGAGARERVFRLLGAVASFRLDPSNAKEPFGVGASGPGWRWPSITDLTNEHVELLADVAAHVIDDEMRARISDVVWNRRRGIEFARMAIAAYLGSARCVEDLTSWSATYERIARAAWLAQMLGAVAFDDVAKHIEEILVRFDNTPSASHLATRLLDLLLSVKRGDPAGIANRAAKYASEAESAGEWTRAQPLWAIAARAHRRSKDVDAERSALVREAETYVGFASAGEQGSVAAHHLRNAIEAYRRIGGFAERVAELHAKMLDEQKPTMFRFTAVSVPIENGYQLLDVGRSAVRGKSFEEALLALCTVTQPSSYDVLKKDVEESASKYLFMSLFGTEVVNDQGKVVARHGALHREGVQDEDALTAHMHRMASENRQLSAMVIDVARETLWNEHALTADDFLPLVANNPFVPRGREQLFARGLHAGLAGDYPVALHLLVPQFEHAIRNLLATHGVIVSSLVNGIQREKDLRTLLEEDVAKKLFDETLLFDFRGLLVSSFGSNLRNMVAHGLLSSADTWSVPVVYFWWLTLVMVCYPRIIRRGQAADGGVDEK